MTIEPHLVVRAGAVYVAAVATALAWAWRRPAAREWTGALLGAMWHVPSLLALNVAAARVGWWRFAADGGTLLAVPVDLWLAWAWIWGGLLPLTFPRVPIAVLAVAALVLDVLAMPLARPVVVLGEAWLGGEVVALVLCLLPGVLLARWTIRDERLAARMGLQMAAFAGLVLFVIPAAALEATGWHWAPPLSRPSSVLWVALQALAIPALLGAAAVHDFVTRGGGTPVPFDPPRRLVTGGLYSYLRNPMQVSGVLLLVVVGAILESGWVVVAGLLAQVFAAGVAGWDEDQDLRARFGPRWDAYRTAVRAWVPRWRPFVAAGATASRLYVSSQCDQCRQVGRWFAARRPSGLAIVPAESHPVGRLVRMTYESGDGVVTSVGVAAIGRALEHLHLGWALAGACLRLPILASVLQLLVDASGGEPRPAEPSGADLTIPRIETRPRPDRPPSGHETDPRSAGA